MTVLGIDPGVSGGIALRVHVPAVPVAQPRQRHRIISSGGRQFASNYTPKDSPANTFKATVRHCVAAVLPAGFAPLERAVRLDATFVFPRPKRLIWSRRPMPRIHHVAKPDRDNLDKAILDALTGLAWRDDSQVCAGEIQKFYAAGDETPHVELVIQELESKGGAT